MHTKTISISIVCPLLNHFHCDAVLYKVLVHPVSPREERWQVEEEQDKVNLVFEVPGQSREDLAVEIDEDVLVIKKKKIHVAGGDVVGQRNTTGGGASTEFRPQGNRKGAAAAGEAAGKEDGEVIYARLLLPAGYSKEGVEAELKSGVLRVSIAKIKEQARRKISINIEVK
jgi:HSP20 family molecular chaperone IbpA